MAISLPDEIYEILERARIVEHRTRSEVIQEALRSHFGEPVYVPGEQEKLLLKAALDEETQHPDRTRSWDEVRSVLREEQ
ncbi:ribbon-helix-helix protein, CopG family [Pseudoclavibacter sp. AY1F1]|uniref:ribbon-helix-helix protein, CopG family n=1 Tax=Pseudoclavibacter sp. AY1F1 TaxID=2080583 RepID=UPI0015E30512|nr:ribbon-helix-helix protein, CopG family [Pseudoclavibacter sp. AY1F1]